MIGQAGLSEWHGNLRAMNEVEAEVDGICDGG